MENLRDKRYLLMSKRNFDPISVIMGMIGIIAAFFSFLTVEQLENYLELRSFLAVVGGTLGIIIFQFNIMTFVRAIVLTFKSFLGTLDKSSLQIMHQVDHAIINKTNLSSLREGKEIIGEYINDSLYMLKSGLIYEEIETFLTSKISDEYQKRERCVDLFKKGANIAPGLGLLGTVVGLIGVLKNLSDPSQIGPSMSLALLTTAYGAGLASLIFSPLAGRLEQQNSIYLESYLQFVDKLKILILREERRSDQDIMVDQKKELS